MKRKLFLMGILLLPGLIALAQQGKPVFDHTEFDFGNIKETGGDVTHTFTFTNKGDAPVVVQHVSTSCGCTVSEWTKEPVLPGQKGTVTARYSPFGRPNGFTKFLTVTTNADPATYTLYIKGNVLPRERTSEELYPQRYGDFGLHSSYVQIGQVFTNTEGTAEVELHNFGEKPAEWSFVDLPPYIQAKPQKILVNPGENGMISLTVVGKKVNDWGLIIAQAPFSAGGVRGSLSLGFTIDEDFSRLTNEQRDKAPELSVPHTVVKFGEVAAGKVVEAVFQIGNTGQSPLVIRKVAVPTSAITVDPAQTKNPILPGKTLQLKVKLNTTGLNGNYVNRITLVTNAPAQTMLFLELQAMVK